VPNYSILGGNRGVHELYQRPEVAGVSRKPKQASDQLPAQAKQSVQVSLSSSDQVQNLAQEYNVRQMTPKDMSQMSQQLFDSGLIEFEDHALLSFQPTMNYQTQQVLPSDADQPRDFIEQWEAQKAMHLSQGHQSFAQKDQKIINILKNLESLSQQQDRQATSIDVEQ